MPDPKKKVPFRLNDFKTLRPIYGPSVVNPLDDYPLGLAYQADVNRQDIPQDINEFLAFRERWIAEQMRQMYEVYSRPGFLDPVGGPRQGLADDLSRPERGISLMSDTFSEYGYNADPNLSAPDAMVTQLRQYMDRLGADERERRGKSSIWRLFNPPQEGVRRSDW